MSETSWDIEYYFSLEQRWEKIDSFDNIQEASKYYHRLVDNEIYDHIRLQKYSSKTLNEYKPRS